MKELEESKPVSIQAFNQKDSEKLNSSPSESLLELIQKGQEHTSLEKEQSSENIINDTLDLENAVDNEYRRIFESTSKETSTDYQRNDSKVAKNRTSVFKQTCLAIQKISALLKCTFKRESCNKEDAKRTLMKDVSTTYNPFPLKSESFSDKSCYKNKSRCYFLASNKKSSHINTVLNFWSKPVPVGSRSAQEVKSTFKESRKNSSITSKLSNFLFTDQVETDEKAEPTEIAKESVNKKEPHESMDSKLKKLFFLKKKSKDKLKNLLNSYTDNMVTTNYCSTIDSMVFACEPKSPSKENKPNKSQYEITKAAWLMKYVTTGIESRNSVKVRWSNDMYSSNSSTTVVELMEYISKGNELPLTSQQSEYNIDHSSLSSPYQSRTQFIQQIYAYMIPRIFYKPSHPYKSHNNVLVASRYKLCDRLVVSRYDPKLHINGFNGIHSENILSQDREISYLGVEIESDMGEQSSEKVVCIVDYESERPYYKNSTLRPKMSEAGDYDNNTGGISVRSSVESGQSETYKTILKRLPMNHDGTLEKSQVFSSKEFDVIGIDPIAQGHTSMVESAAQTHEYQSEEEQPKPKSRVSEYVCEFSPCDLARKSPCPRNKVPQKCRDANRNRCRYKRPLTFSKCYNMFLEPLSSTASRWASAYSSRSSVLSHSRPELLLRPISACKMCLVFLIDDYLKNEAKPLQSSEQMLVERSSYDKIILPIIQSCSTVFMSTKDKSGRKKYYAATFKRKSRWRSFFSRKESEVAKIKSEVFKGISFMSNRSATEVKSTICRPLTVDTSVGGESPLNKGKRKSAHQKRKCVCVPRVSHAHKSTHVSQLDIMACKCTLTASSSSGEEISKHSYLENHDFRGSLEDNCYFEKRAHKEHLDKGINTDGLILVIINEPNIVENEKAKEQKDTVFEKQMKQRECSKVCPFNKKQCARDRLRKPTISDNQQSESAGEITEDDKNICCKMSESTQPPRTEVTQKTVNPSVGYNNYDKGDKKENNVMDNFQAPVPILIKNDSSQKHIDVKGSKNDILYSSNGGCCCCDLPQPEKNKSNNKSRKKVPFSVSPLPLPILQEPFPNCSSESSDSHRGKEKQKEFSEEKEKPDDQIEPSSVYPLPIPILQGSYQETERISSKCKERCLQKRKQYSVHPPLPLPVLQEPLPVCRSESSNANQGQEKIQETKEKKPTEFLDKCTKVTPKSSAIGKNQKTKISQYTNIYQSQEHLKKIRYKTEYDKSTCIDKNIAMNYDNNPYIKSPDCLDIVKDDSSSLERLPTETVPLIEKLYTPSLHEIYSNNRDIKTKNTVKAKDFNNIEINLQLQVTERHDTESGSDSRNKNVCRVDTNEIDSDGNNMTKNVAPKKKLENNPKKELNIRILIKNKNKRHHKKDTTTDTGASSNKFSDIAIKKKQSESPNNYVDDNDKVSSYCSDKKQLYLEGVEILPNNVEKNLTFKENSSTNKQVTRDTRKASNQIETTKVQESSTITGSTRIKTKRKKKAVATVNEAEILQMYEMKKAVLDIYAEKTTAIDGSERYVAKLPKFVHKAEKHLNDSLDSFNNIEPCNWNRNFILMHRR